MNKKFNLAILILINFIIFIGLFEISECKLLKRKFLYNSKKSKTNPNSKYADSCSQFQYFNQYVDHFNFDNTHNDLYEQRYIISDQFWPGNNNPIFFYTGNEGDIQWFCENTGFVWEIAEKFGALVVFAEHRYYGESLPYGNKSYENPFINFLTSEQALADYAYLISFLKSTIKSAKNSPVVAFGGSYGGMLSSWFRMKYPNIVVGALAASAPIFQYSTDCDTFQAIVSDSFRKADPLCPKIIRSSWDIINQFGQNQTTLDILTDIFKLCKPLENSDDLKNWIIDVYGNIAMSNYPYPAEFLSPLPAWPVKVMCSNITNYPNENLQNDPISILKAIYQGINVYQNYTGDLKCTDISSDVPTDITEISWDYQTCTEFVFPTCSNGVNDMFEPQQWDYKAYCENCISELNVLPRSDWPVLHYGGSVDDIKSYSNIIFSNGDLDPWSGGGVLATISDNLVAIVIENGAHHLDLRASNPNDPKSVIIARLQEIDIIQKWIDEYNSSQ